MRLTPDEMQLFHRLRALPTAKFTVVKFGGEIRSIRAEINIEISAKANLQKTPPGTKIVRISEAGKSDETQGAVDKSNQEG